VWPWQVRAFCSVSIAAHASNERPLLSLPTPFCLSDDRQVKGKLPSTRTFPFVSFVTFCQDMAPVGVSSSPPSVGDRFSQSHTLLLRAIVGDQDGSRRHNKKTRLETWQSNGSWSCRLEQAPSITHRISSTPHNFTAWRRRLILLSWVGRLLPTLEQALVDPLLYRRPVPFRCRPMYV
jgi:hypothetical protein